MFRKENVIDDVVIYLKKNLKKGYTKDSLLVALRNQGYSRMLIERAIGRTEDELAAEAPVLKTKPEIKYEIILPEKDEKKRWWQFFK